MKEKKIRMYLIFWFTNSASSKYKNLSCYRKTKTGEEYLQFACVEKIDKRYVDYEEVENEFLKKYKENQKLVNDLIYNVDGKFNIEIVPEFTFSTPTPAILVDKKLIDLINSLGDKFGHLEVDSYIV